MLYILLSVHSILVGGNPLTVMANQISMELHKIRQKCPLYETHGKSVCTWTLFTFCWNVTKIIPDKSSSLRICLTFLSRLTYCQQKPFEKYDNSKNINEYIHCTCLSTNEKLGQNSSVYTRALCTEQNSHWFIKWISKEGVLASYHFYRDGVFKASTM